MYLAHSALKPCIKNMDDDTHDETQNEVQLRYQAYLSACTKHSNLIADIQKYFPGWLPGFQ